MNFQKPTAKVHPLNQGESNHVVSLGYAGLVNLGNTCFMNCVIQVMVNTREFRDYFLGKSIDPQDLECINKQ